MRLTQGEEARCAAGGMRRTPMTAKYYVPNPRLTYGDRRGIERIVERLHVGTPDGQVIQYVRTRIKNFDRLPPGTRSAVDRHAIQAHRGNQKLYGHVMSGSFASRNPRSWQTVKSEETIEQFVAGYLEKWYDPTTAAQVAKEWNQGGGLSRLQERRVGLALADARRARNPQGPRSRFVGRVRAASVNPNGHAQFAELEAKFRELGRKGFTSWLSRRLADSVPEQRRIIRLMAWNDHNSDWALNREEVLTKGTIDGKTITVGDISESMANMVEGSANPRHGHALATRVGDGPYTLELTVTEFVERGRVVRFPVADMREASAKYSALRDQSGLGGSEFGEGKVFDSAGHQIARVSYNGRVWDMSGKLRSEAAGNPPRTRAGAEKALDKQIEQAWYRHGQGVQVSVLDIGKIFRDVKLELAAGTDIDTATKLAVARYRRSNPGGGDLKPYAVISREAVHATYATEAQARREVSRLRARGRSARLECTACLGGRASTPHVHRGNVAPGGVGGSSNPSKCPLCGVVLTSIKVLPTHIRKTHGRNPLTREETDLVKMTRTGSRALAVSKRVIRPAEAAFHYGEAAAYNDIVNRFGVEHNPATCANPKHKHPRNPLTQLEREDLRGRAAHLRAKAREYGLVGSSYAYAAGKAGALDGIADEHDPRLRRAEEGRVMGNPPAYLIVDPATRKILLISRVGHRGDPMGTSAYNKAYEFAMRKSRELGRNLWSIVHPYVPKGYRVGEQVGMGFHIAGYTEIGPEGALRNPQSKRTYRIGYTAPLWKGSKKRDTTGKFSVRAANEKVALEMAADHIRSWLGTPFEVWIISESTKGMFPEVNPLTELEHRHLVGKARQESRVARHYSREGKSEYAAYHRGRAGAHLDDAWNYSIKPERNPRSEFEMDMGMWEKGYRFKLIPKSKCDCFGSLSEGVCRGCGKRRIDCQSGECSPFEPLYTKTIQQASKLMREEYPGEVFDVVDLRPKRNPLTRGEAAGVLRQAGRDFGTAKARDPRYPALYYAGAAAAGGTTVEQYGPPEARARGRKIAGRAGRLATDIHWGGLRNPLLQTVMLSNPRVSRAAQSFISSKISKLVREGYPQQQAIAIAYSMARRGGFKVPATKNPPTNALRPPPWKKGQKVKVEEVLRWAKSTGNRRLADECEKALKLQTRANRRPIEVMWNFDGSGPLEAVNVLVHYGEAPDIYYKPPPGSKKGQHLYKHKFGDTGRGRTKSRPVPVLVTPDGKNVVLPLGPGQKATDWFRG